MLQLAQSTSAPTSLAVLAVSAANAEGLLAYDQTTTPPWLVPILQAQEQPKVSTLNDQELLTTLIAHFQRAAINLGHRSAMMDKDTANLYALEILALLRQRWHYLTRGEIEQVFRLGSLGQLPPPVDRDGRPTEEVIYLSPKTVAIWFQRYKYQIKPQAMEYAQRLAYQSSELPPHHPVYAAWRIERLVHLLSLSPAALRQLRSREGDFKSLLYLWLKEIGALSFNPKPVGFWQRLEELEKRRLCRIGERPPAERMLALATGQQEKYDDRLNAAKRWRTLCLWLNSQRTKGRDLHSILWPHAQAIYLHFASESQRDAYLSATDSSVPHAPTSFNPFMALAS